MARPVLGNDPFVKGAASTPLPPHAAPPKKSRATETAKAAAPSVRIPGPVGAAPTPAAATAAVPIPIAAAPVAAAPATRAARAVLAEPTSSRPSQPPAAPRPTPLTESGFLDFVRQAARGLRWLPGVSLLDGAWAVLQTSIGIAESAQLDAYGQDRDLLARLRAWRDFLYTRYFRVSVTGAEAIPSGGVLLVANHAGALPLDGWILSEAVRRERADLADPRWLLEDQIFAAPFLGTLFNRLGALRASPENAERLLAEGRPLAVFPEGIHGIGKLFNQRYRLQRFGRGGFIKLALRLHVPVVPVAIVGSEESSLLAKLPIPIAGLPYLPISPGLVPLPARWSIRFGAPIDLEQLSASAAQDVAAVERLTERTRSAIRTLLDQSLAERGSVF